MQNDFGHPDGSLFVEGGTELVEPINDEKGKPVNILRMVGKRPIIAVGNSEGDRDMLEYSDDKNPATPDLQMIVNHDDPEREYEYAVEKVSHLAAENGWQVISMKKDWERVFDFSKASAVWLRSG